MILTLSTFYGVSRQMKLPNHHFGLSGPRLHDDIIPYKRFPHYCLFGGNLSATGGVPLIIQRFIDLTDLLLVCVSCYISGRDAGD